MTTTEISAIVGLVGIIFGAGVAWGYMRHKTTSQEHMMEAIKKRVDEHERAPMPHAACPVHEAILKSILVGQGEIKADLKTLSGEILVIAKSLGAVKK